MQIRFGDFWGVHAALVWASRSGNPAWKDLEIADWATVRALFGINDYDPTPAMAQKVDQAVAAWVAANKQAAAIAVAAHPKPSKGKS